MQNAVGSEKLALPIPLETQYWNGAGFVTNAQDSCTSFPRSAIVLSAMMAISIAAPLAVALALVGLVFTIVTTRLGEQSRLILADNYRSVLAVQRMKESLERVRKVLDNAQGRQLRPIDCHRIMCHAADAVLSGGTVDGIGETYCDRCTRGGPALRKDKGFYPWGGVNGDSRKKIIPSLWFNGGRWDDGKSHYWSISPSTELRFSTRLTASVGANFDETTDNTQWFGNFTEGGKTNHTFAHLDQRTVSMNISSLSRSRAQRSSSGN